METDWPVIQNAVQEIEKGIFEWTPGIRNIPAMKELLQKASAIGHATTDDHHFFNERAENLSSWLSALFGGDRRVNVERTRRKIQDECRKIRERRYREIESRDTDV